MEGEMYHAHTHHTHAKRVNELIEREKAGRQADWDV